MDELDQRFFFFLFFFFACLLVVFVVVGGVGLRTACMREKKQSWCTLRVEEHTKEDGNKGEESQSKEKPRAWSKIGSNRGFEIDRSHATIHPFICSFSRQRASRVFEPKGWAN